MEAKRHRRRESHLIGARSPRQRTQPCQPPAISIIDYAPVSTPTTATSSVRSSSIPSARRAEPLGLGLAHFEVSQFTVLFFVGCRRRVPFAVVKRDGVCLSVCLKRLTMAASTFSVVKVSLMSLTPQLQNRTVVLTITFIDTHRAGNNIPNHLSRFDVRPLPSVAAIPAPIQPIPSVGDNIRPNIVHTNEDAERDREVCYTLCMATLWPRSYRRCRLRL